MTTCFISGTDSEIEHDRLEAEETEIADEERARAEQEDAERQEEEDESHLTHCPITGRHCPSCHLLTASQWLLSLELNFHGCCGGEYCIAYPPHQEPDPLGDVLREVPTYLARNECRYEAYRQWCGRARQKGLLPEKYTDEVDSDGKTKRHYIWEACILHRIRSVWPDFSGKYTGHR